MQIHFVNVGYGEAILVQRDDFIVLIDGGTNRTEEYENPGCIRVSDYMRKIGISKVDLIIITHIHDDHIGGIPEVIKSFPVFEVWINLNPDTPDLGRIRNFESVRMGNLSGVLFKSALESYAELLKECEKKKIPVLQKGEEDGLIFPNRGLGIQLLTPDRLLQEEMLQAYEQLKAEPDESKAEALFYEIDRQGNRTSISLRIKAGKTAILLTGDKADGWERIREKYGNSLKSQILKVTHHGQIDGLPEAMLEASDPEHFIICASADRRFNSAHPAVIARAGDYLQEKEKNGGIYITGCLRDGRQAEMKICSVYFLCDEHTGEITACFGRMET